jgi:hypothetical protein
MKTSEVYVSVENLYLMYKNDLDETFINECIHFQSHLQNIKYHPKSIIDMSIMMKKHELEDIFSYVSIVHTYIHTYVSLYSSDKLYCRAVIFDT